MVLRSQALAVSKGTLAPTEVHPDLVGLLPKSARVLPKGETDERRVLVHYSRVATAKDRRALSWKSHPMPAWFEHFQSTFVHHGRVTGERHATREQVLAYLERGVRPTAPAPRPRNPVRKQHEHWT